MWMLCLIALLALLAATVSAAPALLPVVEVEEPVYTYAPADNGADPTWCWGCAILVRAGQDLFASGLEIVPNARPLNNVRWVLFKRAATGGWTLQQADPKDRTREPCPLAGFPDGRLLMSVNPTLLTDPQQEGGGPARPEILEFSVKNPQAPPKTILPVWEGQPSFSEHSYRTFTADARTGDVLLMQNVGYEGSQWALLDKAGKTVKAGFLAWPKLRPGDIEPYGGKRCRANYPEVVLRNRAVYICGAAAFDNWDRVKDPVAQKDLMGRKWGGRWRRLYYAWTPDITKQPFSEWIEISNTMATGGWLFPGDLHVDDKGTAHVLWYEAPIGWELRARHFPEIKVRPSFVKYAQVRQGQVTLTKALVEGGEGSGLMTPEGKPRLQPAPGGRLFAVYCAFNYLPADKRVWDDYVMEIQSDGSFGEPVKLPLTKPLREFFTLTPRGGARPSQTLEMLGRAADSQYALHYARIRLW